MVIPAILRVVDLLLTFSRWGVAVDGIAALDTIQLAPVLANLVDLEVLSLRGEFCERNDILWCFVRLWHLLGLVSEHTTGFGWQGRGLRHMAVEFTVLFVSLYFPRQEIPLGRKVLSSSSSKCSRPLESSASWTWQVPCVFLSSMCKISSSRVQLWSRRVSVCLSVCLGWCVCMYICVCSHPTGRSWLSRAIGCVSLFRGHAPTEHTPCVNSLSHTVPPSPSWLCECGE